MRTKTEFAPSEMDSSDVYKILTGCIVPRPIGFLTTVGPDGVYNAAPFSFFNMISHHPPLVCVSIARKQIGPKDTLRNMTDNGEFVVNIVNANIVRRVDTCSAPFPAYVDELAISGLASAPSSVVKPPRIDESPANFECRVVQIVGLPDDCTHTLVIGRIIRMHVHADILLANNRIDQARLAVIGRMAGNSYCRIGEIFAVEERVSSEYPKGVDPEFPAK